VNLYLDTWSCHLASLHSFAAFPSMETVGLDLGWISLLLKTRRMGVTFRILLYSFKEIATY
jgi:hypothetical protein